MRDGLKLSLIGVGVIALVTGAMALSIQEQKQWDAFAQTHQCKLITHADGYSTYGYYNSKYQTVWVPSRDTFHCNDGVDYTR